MVSKIVQYPYIFRQSEVSMKQVLPVIGALALIGCVTESTQQTARASAAQVYNTVSQAATRVMNDVNTITVAGDTPLIVASRQGNRQQVQASLASGADVNAANAQGTTALMAASQAGQAEIIKLLGTNKKLDLEATDANFDTALMIAVQRQQLESVKALLALGANANFMKAGMSVLIAASYKGNAPIVQALLEAGANAAWADENGETALDVALANNYPAVAAVLRQHQTAQK